MKKTFKFFAAALAIVAAASCAKEISNDNIQNENPAEETVHMTFSASIDAEEDTKTALNGKVVEWKESDNIKLFKNDYYPSVSGICAVVAGTISQDKKFADFEGDLVPSTDYIAAYPADWYVDRYGTPYRIDFPGLAEQVAVENSFDSSKHLMIANSLSDDNHFQFKNVCALAKVTIGTDDVYSVIVEGRSQFSTSGDYGSIGGPLGYKTNDLSWYAIQSSQVHSITLKNEDGSALRKGATYYIVLPACTIKNFTLSACDQNGNVLASKSKASDFVVERNKVYDLGTLAYQLKVGDYYYSDGKTGVAYKSNAVGVVFYVGKPQDVDPTIPGGFTKGLVVGLKEYSDLYFGTENDGNTSSLQPDYYGVNTYASSKGGANAVLDAASKNIIGISRAYEMTVKHAKETGGSKLYSSYNFGTNSYGSGWMIPSAKEYSLMYKNIDVLNSKDQFADLQVWTSSDKSKNDESLGEYVIGYHTIWQANINGEAGWRCLNYYYIDSSREGVVQVVSNTNSRTGSKGHIGRAIFAF